MTTFGALRAGAGLCALLVAAAPASAQKSQDTLRLAVTETFKGLSSYYYPATEASQVYRAVYDTLVAYNEHENKFEPAIAKSWTRISDTVLEFDLRDDIVFHNGDKLTADDVVGSLTMAADAKYNFQFKNRYTWITKVEKLGPYKVRTTSDGLNATDMLHMAYRAFIENNRVFASHSDPAEYGLKTPIGTGPYKVTDFDRNRALSVERFDGAKTGRAPIRRVRAMFIPDQQTQIAELMVGNVDVMRNISTDNAKMVGANPKLATTAIDSMTINYLLMDAANRSGKKMLSDVRVRRAIAMAINRDAIKASIVPGGSEATLANAMCFKTMFACAWSVEPPRYDPEGAKKLLAEAGYPNGFDIELTVEQVVKDQGTAIAGDLRRIGIRASIDLATLVTFRKKRSEGTLELFTGYYPNGGFPDSGNALDVYFGDPSRDFTRDPYIAERVEAGMKTGDLAKRTALYREAFNKVNEMSYYLPISSLPVMWAHSRDVKLEKNLTSANQSDISDFFWR